MDVDLLLRFCLLAPTKVLFVGADVLLTMLFCCFSKFEDGDAPIEPAPMTDAELGLVVRGDVGGVGGVLLSWSFVAQVQVIKEDTQRQTVWPCWTSCGSMPFSAGTGTRATGFGTYRL